MDCTVTRIPYKATGHFSKIAIDYIERSQLLQAFYAHDVSIEGVRTSIAARKSFSTDRRLLHSELKKQYSDLSVSNKLRDNIELLLNENTFTICTAHQPNIFTGHLYFIYKILHAIKLADSLSTELKEYKFVPVFYMGSEDADLEELGNIWLNGEKLTWQTDQSGAVGRMGTAGLEKIIERIEGELSVNQYGEDLIKILKRCSPRT